MALVDQLATVRLAGERALSQPAGVGAQSHGTALLRHILLRAHEVDDGIRAVGVELGRACARQAHHVARKLAHGDLHAQADAKVWNLALARVLGCADLSFKRALSKAPGHQNAGSIAQRLVHVILIKLLAVHQLHLHATVKEHAGVMQRLDNGEIRVGQLGVLAHHGDLHRVDMAVRMVLLGQERIPLRHVAFARVQPQPLADAQVEVLVGEKGGHVVDRRAVLVGKDAVGVHVAKRRDLGARIVADLMIAAQDDDIRLDAQAAQLFDGMLRGLGLNLVRGGDVGHQRNVDAAYVLGAGIFAVLADRLDKRLALDVANGAAQLGDDHVGPGLLFNGAEAGLDGVGHVRNHLHGTAQKVAAALASD